MKEKELKNIIKNNKKSAEKSVLRSAQSWTYDTPTPMVVIDCEEGDNGFVKISTAIKISDKEYSEKEFIFKNSGIGQQFFDDFLNTLFPDSTKAVNANDLIGKRFIGQVVCNTKDGKSYDNLEALELCPDKNSNAASDDEDDDEGFMEVDGDELPF